MTEDPKELVARREALSHDEQMLDAQSQCVPCALCGSAAAITDAGEGAGYYITCSGRRSFREYQGCLVGSGRVRGWAYNASEWWNRLHCLTADRERSVPQWQSISTAPKDGTPILIFQPQGRRSHHMPFDALHEGEFTYKWDDPRLKWYDDARWAIGYWRPWGGWGNRNSHTVEPSHWMPLPAAPLPENEALCEHLFGQGEG